ncbi:MAG TPA: calcium/proton exchanger, partial [Candidatus Obscuribacterales bacterium]
LSTKDRIFTVLLVFVPISIAAHVLEWGDLVVFLTACAAILPLAAWMGTATEEIAVVLGPSWGGLMNATFGNATELIIALLALNKGLVEVVKASITGSILGNLLLVMGLSMLLGGLKYKEQTFQSVIARVNGSSMNLAVIAILLPATASRVSATMGQPLMQKLSYAVAVVLIVVYGLTLLFSMKTHAYLYDVGVAAGKEAPPEATPALEDSSTAIAPPTHEAAHAPNLTLWVTVLLLATVAVAVESEFLVDTLEVASEGLGLSAFFTGVILLPIVGNAAEHATAVTVAMKDKMDLSISVAVGSSLQIALFVTPVLILAGWVLGQPMDLNFSTLELLAVTVAVLIANSISSDGRSNWLEGVLLVATYIILALTFYIQPLPALVG